MQKLLETEDGCLYIDKEAPHILDGVFIHWDIYEWSPNKVRKYKEMWRNITTYLLAKGIKDIYAIPPTEFEEKLIKMFGFKYTGLHFKGFKLMRYE